MTAPVRISVVVPTFQRRELVAALVRALGEQDYDRPFEVIVVVDGSTDGTAAALAALDLPPRLVLRVVSQPNRGAARARNRGAAEASGEILLFLDDDMTPDPRLLREHDLSHAQGADVVSGAIPLHPDSPPGLLSDGVRAWADARARRCAEPSSVPRFDDIVSGQMSVRRELFRELGGFDERFTTAGSYGNEDADLGYRLVARGARVVHNGAAVTRQRYVVRADQHLRHYHQVGQADVALVRKHPELGGPVFGGQLAASRMHRLVRRPVLAAPWLAGLVTAALRRFVVRRVDDGARGPLIARLFFALRSVEYWRGVHGAGGEPRARALRVLCYHAIADLAGYPEMEPYGVPADTFRDHLTTLKRSGYRFVTADEVLRFLDGRGGLPRHALLLTFDDCYRDLAESAMPLLEAEGIPTVAFAVSGRLGGVNDWDAAGGGAPALSLLDAGELAALAGRGVEIGSHSHTHPELTTLPDAALRGEIRQSLEQLHRVGFGRVRLFAYPYGEHDARVRQAVRAAGLRAAFTTEPGWVRAGDDPFALRRVEIFRDDVGRKFRRKVALAGHQLDPRHYWGQLRGWARVRTRLRQWRGGDR